MKIFILCTGRNGSVAFMKACQHIENFTCGHETLSRETGQNRLNFPDNHIESDNRLSWILGRVDEKFGDDAFYVHMTRNRKDTATSFNRRWNTKTSIIKSYCEGILMTPLETVKEETKLTICEDYYDTVYSNIRFFLKDKTHKMTIDLTQIKEGFTEFWKNIGARGNMEAALEEFNKAHNKSTKNYWDNIKYRAKLFVMGKLKK